MFYYILLYLYIHRTTLLSILICTNPHSQLRRNGRKRKCGQSKWWQLYHYPLCVWKTKLFCPRQQPSAVRDQFCVRICSEWGGAGYTGAWLRIKLVCGVVSSISISVHMTMLTSPIIVTISCVLVTRVAASPIETQDEAMEHRAGEALDSLVSEFRDSSVYPLILNPLAVSWRLLPIIQSSDKLSMSFVCRSTSSTAALSSPSTITPPAPTPPWPWTCASPPSSWPRSIPEPDNCCLIFLFYILYYILLDLSVSWKIY